ncbi:MAG: leucine--tRNA ligase [Oligoflexia bacterium]|nr:leucine--tRNA ligase [Oligoflexia bacterium]
MDYGTGAIMAVPAHDERDFEFAKNFKLPIKKIMECEELPFTEDSLHIQSDFLNGLNKEEAIKKMISEIEKNNYGKPETQYKLKDWIFSRQRYWGEPFPVVHFKDKIKAIAEKDLPVILPKTTHYEPSEKGEPPLARQPKFINYTDPQTGEKGKREGSTMPGYAASSWYFLRYTDPKNNQAPFDFEKQKYWMPVDLYVGGAEHTVGHLLYARFWQKFLYDMNMVSHKEPFKKLIHQGMILGEDSQKMSKSRGNTANPDSLKDKYGADTIRVYITFLGPLEKDKPWSSQGIEGSRRFLERVWRLCFNDKGNVLPEKGQMSQNMDSLLNRTIKKVTEDIENLNLNTAISAMMVLVNELYRKQVRNHKTLKILAQLLMPFAPHIAEEIWSALGGEGFVSLSPWPVFQKELIQEKEHTIGVQVNGKTRSSITCLNNTSESTVLEAAKEKTAIHNALKGKIVKKVIYKAGRILNIITN